MATSNNKAKTTAAEKRVANDTALEARIAARKASKPAPTPKVEVAPFVPDAPKLSEQIAAATDAGAPKPKAKRVAKPRATKPEKVETIDLSSLVTKIAAKATATAVKKHKKEMGTLIKTHKVAAATAKKQASTNAKHAKKVQKEAIKQAVAAAEKKAYAAGLKAGAAQSTKGMLAALRGK